MSFPKQQNKVSDLDLLRIALTSENINFTQTYPNEISVFGLTSDPLIKLQEICIELPTSVVKLSSGEYNLLITVSPLFKVSDPVISEDVLNTQSQKWCWLVLRAYLYWHGELRTVRNVWLDPSYVNSSLSIGGYMEDRGEVELLYKLVERLGISCGRRMTTSHELDSLVFPGNFLTTAVFTE